jgi:hypothetical protein
MSDKRRGSKVDVEYVVRIARLMLVCLILCCTGCSDDTEDSEDPVETRSFRMGSSPFFASVDGEQVIFPDWRFENLDDRDLLSLHVDDFWGVPWDYCDATACSGLPHSWVDQWRQLADAANATAMSLYLSLSPLGGRRTLAPTVLSNGSTRAGWNSNVDGDGCYAFDSDVDAARYKASYITYLKYIIDLVNPDYFSPAVEMNIPFTNCPLQKTAWIAWYNDVQAAIKAAYPQLIVFPTFQLEHMYGISDAAAACSSGTVTQCFDSRLSEALSIPADRIALSSYPSVWVYHDEFGYSFPRDTLARIAEATTRKIWISETGWPAIPVLSSYEHEAGGSCGAELIPSTLDVPGTGQFDLANDTAHADYMAWLLDEAQDQGLEAVVWWLNRDYLDDAVTGSEACPCLPESDNTCFFLDQFYDLSGNTGEILQRMFGNMALRYYDGSPRPGQALWKGYLQRQYQQ